MRIIYKIKSSWDFISSQILIYLKRRWNSKMAISIKNHEDRIAALEKKITISKNDVWMLESFRRTGIGLTIDDMYIGAVKLDHPDGGMRKRRAYFPKTFTTEPFVWITDNNDGVTREYVGVDWPRLEYVDYEIDTNGAMFILGILKLYYNFSYNITREFYKVKFKLRHYLCSHLQKFI